MAGIWEQGRWQCGALPRLADRRSSRMPRTLHRTCAAELSGSGFLAYACCSATPMSKQDTVPKKSGYDESQPKDKHGTERKPAPDAPRQPQNAPNAKPKPSSS